MFSRSILTRSMNNYTSEQSSNSVVNENEPIDPSNMIHSNINLSQNSCCICFDDVNDNSTELSCGHKFHSNCIIHWFRSGHQDCPYCRALPTYDSLQGISSNTRGRYQFNRKFARRKEAPLSLKKLVEKLRKYEDLERGKRRKYQTWFKSKEGKEYRKLQTIARRLRCARSRYRWGRSGRDSINSLKGEIAAYPIIPVPVSVRTRQI